MPPIEYKGEYFDLEFEHFVTNGEIIDHLELMMKGGTFTDKYGTTIKIESWNDKEDFFRGLMSSILFQYMYRHKFNEFERDLLLIKVSSIRQ